MRDPARKHHLAALFFPALVLAACAGPPPLETDCEVGIWGCPDEGADDPIGGDGKADGLFEGPGEGECDPGERACADESSYVECLVDESGGARWTNPRTCRRDVCAGEGHCCENPCPAGETICTEQGIQRCVQMEDGCYAFSDPTPCPSGQTCGEGGECVDVCQSTCTRGTSLCDGDQYRECIEVEPNCYQLAGALQNCPQDQVCRNGVCQRTCQDTCPLERATVCDANQLKRCGRTESGCLAWQDQGESCGVDPAKEGCSSFTLGRDVPHNTCVQTARGNSNNNCGVSGCTWAICNDGTWDYFCGAALVGCDPMETWGHATCGQ